MLSEIDKILNEQITTDVPTKKEENFQLENDGWMNEWMEEAWTGGSEHRTVLNYTSCFHLFTVQLYWDVFIENTEIIIQ